MNSVEFRVEKEMDYDSLISYLLSKYGPATGNYFLNESCKSKNKKITRTSEGLYCHHIGENEYIDLGHPMHARKHSFEYQLAKNLVYCNLLEHLLLHIKIYNETEYDTNSKDFKMKKRVTPKKVSWDTNCAYFLDNNLPVSGGFEFIRQDCNELFDNQGSNILWKQKCYEQIRDNLNDYTDLLAELVQSCIDTFTGTKEARNFQIGTRIYSKSKGTGVVEQIVDRNKHFSAPISQDCVIQFNSEKITIPRTLIDMGDYNTEVDKIIDGLSKTNAGNICNKVRDLINTKIRR